VVVGGAVVVTGTAVVAGRVVAGTVVVGVVVAFAGTAVTTAVEDDVFELAHEASNIIEMPQAVRDVFFTPRRYYRAAAVGPTVPGIAEVADHDGGASEDPTDIVNNWVCHCRA
jgi:hypothetical protein